MTLAKTEDSHLDPRAGTPIASALTPLDDLGDAIATLAARLHAGTYELLVLLREFDARAGWNIGFLSCAHWLHWRTGIDLGAAREKVRVARALSALPAICEAMRRGRISYAKVRALTRVATPENEERLLTVALSGTAAHVEHIVRAWRQADALAAAHESARRDNGRALDMWVDDDGMLVIRGRLSPEAGAVVQRAVEAAADRLWRELAAARDADAAQENATAAQRRADALAVVAEAALSGALDAGTAGDRYQVVVHVEVTASGSSVTGSATESAVDGVLEVGTGAIHVSAETSRQLACDASVVAVRYDGRGTVLDVGRKTRTIPVPIRRALAARDGHCRFPGCTARRCDAHHIRHWMDGGVTSLGNTLLLCRRHHRAVHRGAFSIRRDDDGVVTFLRPDGCALEAAPPLSRCERAASGLNPRTDAYASGPKRLADATDVGPWTTPVWDGTPLDVEWAMDVLYEESVTHPRADVVSGDGS